MIILTIHGYYFFAYKNEAYKVFVKHCRRIQNEKGFTRGKLDTTLFLMFDEKKKKKHAYCANLC